MIHRLTTVRSAHLLIHVGVFVVAISAGAARCPAHGWTPPPNDTCTSPPPVLVPGSVTGNTLQATPDVPPAFPCGTTITAPGVWYIVVGTGNTITLTTCSPLTDYDTKINVYCGCGDPCITGNDDDNVCAAPGFTPPGWRSTVSWCSQLGFPYVVLVQGYSGAVGTFELIATDDQVPCAPAAACTACVECPPGPATDVEIDPSKGGLCSPLGPDLDGGCNDPLLAFQVVKCPQYVCGTVAFDGSTRDTDWYILDMPTYACVSWTVQADFDAFICVMPATCPAPLLDYDFVPACGQATVVADGFFASYYLFIAPLFTDPPIACSAAIGNRYTGTITCPVTCPAMDCPPGAYIEHEIDCGLPVDTVNGGCNSSPPVFSPLPCNTPICGSFAVNSPVRDTDWYRVDLLATCEYRFTVTSVSPAVIGLVGILPLGFPGCSGSTGTLDPSATTTSSCATAFVRGTLPPGTYYFFVASSVFTTSIGCDECLGHYIAEFDSQCCDSPTGLGFADCNGNKTPDDRDIQSGVSADCVGAGAADVHTGLRGDGVPDECQCVADWNRDGVVNSADVGDFINDWFSDLENGTTFTNIYDCRNSGVNSTDVSEMVNEYFAAQAGLRPGCGI
jgi:hypothetical protein